MEKQNVFEILDKCEYLSKRCADKEFGCYVFENKTNNKSEVCFSVGDRDIIYIEFKQVRICLNGGPMVRFDKKIDIDVKHFDDFGLSIDSKFGKCLFVETFLDE